MFDVLLAIFVLVLSLAILFLFGRLCLWTVAAIAMIPDPAMQGKAVRRLLLSVLLILSAVLAVIWQRQAVADIAHLIKWLLGAAA